jgi:hypothetical protein
MSNVRRHMSHSGARELVVQLGTYLYAGQTECDIRIVRAPVRYGTGDDEDTPDIANDQNEPTFYVEYGSATQRGTFASRSVGHPSLEAAMSAAEASPGIGTTVTWAGGPTK